VNLRSAAVLGGGPGGLYAARLLKLSQPDCRVDVYEQSQPGLTFGFGVGLASRTQRNLRAADADSHADIVGSAWEHEMAMAVGDREVRLPAGDLIAIGRSALLGILRRHAEAAGVRVRHGRRLSAGELDADLIIAADGVSSATREAHRAEFGARVSVHDGFYLWAGTDFALPAALFRPVETEFGFFVTHAYPYQADRSTFLIEADPETWRRSGFDATTEQTPPDASDEQALGYLSKVFHDDLQGPADREPYPLAPVPHGDLRPLAPPERGAARRRRPHGPLLHRLRHQAGHGGRHRARPRAGRGP